MGCRTLKKMTHMSILSFGTTISRKEEFGADTKTFKVRYSVFSVCYSSVVGKVLKKKRIEATLFYWMVFIFHISQRSAVVCVESAPHTPADTNSLKSTMCVLIHGWRQYATNALVAPVCVTFAEMCIAQLFYQVVKPFTKYGNNAFTTFFFFLQERMGVLRDALTHCYF